LRELERFLDDHEISRLLTTIDGIGPQPFGPSGREARRPPPPPGISLTTWARGSVQGRLRGKMRDREFSTAPIPSSST
jgi:hypothetical protein